MSLLFITRQDNVVTERGKNYYSDDICFSENTKHEDFQQIVHHDNIL